MHNPFASFTLDDLRGRATLKWQAYPTDVLPLWVAEMDTLLAEPVRDAVLSAVERGEVGYPWGRGYPDALARFAAAEWGWSVDAGVMRHTTDVMTGLANLVRIVTSADGTLVITVPVYPPFLDLPAITERSHLFVPMTAAGRLDLPGLATAFAECRRLGSAPTLVLANPYNPTGTAHTRAELEAVAGLAVEYDVRVIVDEIHAPLVYAPAAFTPYLSVPESEDAYAVHSASKAFNLAGLKAALIVPGPRAVDEITARLPSSVDHGASSTGVLAHTVALTEGGDWLAAHRAGLVENRALLGEWLAEMLPEVRWRRPEATYLAWLDCRQYDLGADPAAAFLERGRVAVNSGLDFGPGGAGHVRLNFATAPNILREALARIQATVQR
ncbi:MAG: aminotransferase class I/II-fold pyridoxal phosphate-dependent enzyme [Microlunatus sp.]|nr:aminotransferase class I/II-fold pyridoxal phosphate-dependent enzyme [Microlunatus sp.]MDN5770133.1 aminotransferase class I/II-fold pyridoxal phosphate-dependent enzyme [Microlunatus sp.]